MQKKPTKYQITFTRYNTDQTGIAETETINGDSLPQVIAQLVLAIVKVTEREKEEEYHKGYNKGARIDDDIPF